MGMNKVTWAIERKERYSKGDILVRKNRSTVVVSFILSYQGSG
jgi:hypothetical protein